MLKYIPAVLSLFCESIRYTQVPFAGMGYIVVRHVVGFGITRMHGIYILQIQWKVGVTWLFLLLFSSCKIWEGNRTTCPHPPPLLLLPVFITQLLENFLVTLVYYKALDCITPLCTVDIYMADIKPSTLCMHGKRGRNHLLICNLGIDQIRSNHAPSQK